MEQAVVENVAFPDLITPTVIRYQFVAADPLASYLLDHQSYDTNNYQALLNDITLSMNYPLTIAKAYPFGLQWKASINKQNRTQIEYKRSRFQDFNDSTDHLEDENVTRTGTDGGRWTRTGGTPNTFDAFAYLNTPFIKGAGALRSKVSFINTVTGDKMYMGFTEENPDKIKAVRPFQLADLKYAIGITADSTPANSTYSTVVNGVETATAVNVGYNGASASTNDRIEISLGEGVLSMSVYPTGSLYATRTVLRNIANFDYSLDLYPIVFFVGAVTAGTGSAQTGLGLSNLRTNIDPYEAVSLGNDSGPDEVPTLGDPPRPTNFNTKVSDISLEFESDTLMDFLGYNKISYGPFETRDDAYAFVAENTFNPIDVPDGLVVELLSHKLRSFDGYTEKRRSILSTIPNLNSSKTRVTFSTNYPLFIDLANADAISGRNIKAKVVKRDLSEITTKGLSTMTLLVKGPKE